ncbi:MAG TPA: hypothetical protein PLS03_01745 [Terrimicrobiaceae bacterium]|nr:hypothetical protein [Terrimicrobiaceae bacterium]
MSTSSLKTSASADGHDDMIICDPPTLRCLQIQWGWITPGTTTSHRARQSTPYLDALQEGMVPATRHFLLVHCGWWLDSGMPRSVRDLYAANPEPNRALTPASASYRRRLAEFVRSGRLEFVVYPYAACVAEATSGEALLRSFRYARDLSAKVFGRTSRTYMNHDAVYGLDWGTVQMPQILRLLGGSYVISGKNGSVVAPDGTPVETFGYAKSFYDLAKDPESLEKPGVYCMELHQHVGHMREFHRGEHFVPRTLGVEVEALTLDEFLSHRNGECRSWVAARMGSKGWYGGVTDALLIEQSVKSVELRLPALEALALQIGNGRPAAKTARELNTLWKKSFVLLDNHLLWQCHRYRPYFLDHARQLMDETDTLEQALFAGGPPVRTIFNPVPWSRDVIVNEGGRDVLVQAVPGWGAAAVDAARIAPCVRSGAVSDFDFGGIRWRLGEAGEVEEIAREGYALPAGGWGSLLHLREEKEDREIPWVPGRKGISHRGCASFHCTVDLSNKRAFEGFLELGAIHGDAYLLRAERVDLNGKVFATEWHKLRSLHWGSFGAADHPGRLTTILLKLAYAAAVRLTVWMACDGEAAIGEAAIRLSKLDGEQHLERWNVRLLTSVAYEGPSQVRAKVLRESLLEKQVCFSGLLGAATFQLTARAGAASPRMEYALRLHYAEPTDLGMSTPPFDPMDGSLLGAQAERPYVPGLAVKFPLPAPARYHADKPYYIQETLDEPTDTWHMDRRDWWMGMSPFIGMNVAMASWGEDSLAVMTRGLKHFYRWRQSGAESLGLSLGASLIQVGTQGHSVREGHPLYASIGRRDHDPYAETPFLRAHGTYEFHFAVQSGLKNSGGCQRTKFWRSAQEFALPASVHASGGRRPCGGMASSNAAVIPTGMECRDGKIAIRVVNMSDSEQTASLSYPRAGGERGELEAVLPPWAVREVIVA